MIASHRLIHRRSWRCYLARLLYGVAGRFTSSADRIDPPFGWGRR